MGMSCLRPAVTGVSPAPGSDSVMEKYDRSTCGLLVACLGALSFGDLFQVSVSSCVQLPAKVGCALLGIARGLLILQV